MTEVNSKDKAAFTQEVLRFLVDKEAYSDVFVFADDDDPKGVLFASNCNDYFGYATADAEIVTLRRACPAASI